MWNPIIVDTFGTRSTKVPGLWMENLLNMWVFLFFLWGASLPLLMRTMLGDFEATFWFMKENAQLLPKPMQDVSQLYLNRYNGVIFGFRNTSYPLDLTNWTATWMPPDVAYDDPTRYNYINLYNEYGDEEEDEDSEFF